MKRTYGNIPAIRTVRTLAVLLLCGIPAAGAADLEAPVIHLNQISPAEQGMITAKVVDESPVEQVILHYRTEGADEYRAKRLEPSAADGFYRAIERELGVSGGPVEYYLVAQDASGNQSTLPARTPEDNPLRSGEISSMANTSEAEVVLGSPEPGAVYESGEQTVMVSFYRTGREIDLNTVRLRIDRVDRTREAEFIGNTLIWEPRRPLSDGVHEIEVIATDVAGDPVGPNVWTFTVKSRMALPLGAEGDFFMGLQRDDRSANNANVPLWNNRIDLGMRGETGWLDWKAGVMLSSEETPFLTSETLPDRQPINRYYVEGRTRHWKVRLGDSNPVFSDLSLKGVRVRGVHAEFTSNHFTTSAVWGINKREIGEQVNLIGRNYRQIDADTYYNLALGDTLSTASGYLVAVQDVNSPGEYSIYEYEHGTPARDVMGLKMNVIPVRSSAATWNLGFNFFGAEDDSTTLSYRYDPDTNLRYYSVYEDSVYTDYKPKKNWVATLETSLAFNDNKTVLSAEIGGTIVTENMFSYVSEDIREDLPTDIDDVFPINGSTQTSFDKLKLKDSTADGVKDAITSVYRFKLDSVIPIPQTNTRFTAEAYRTPTHYVSLGNPQQRTDMAGFKADLRTRVLMNQVSFNLGYNSYSDNLENERRQYNTSGDLTDLTKDTSITSFSVGYTPNQWREYAPNITLGYRRYNAANNLNLNAAGNDSLAMIDTDTGTFTLNLGATLPVGMQKHTGMLSFSRMSITDNRPLKDYDLLESTNTTVLFNVHSQIDPMPLTVTTSLGLTGNSSYIKLGNQTDGYSRKELATDITMFNLAGTYKWFRDRRLKTTAGFGYIGSSNGEDGTIAIDNTKLTFKLEGEYNLTSVSAIGASFRYIAYSDNTDNGIDYTEPIIGLTLRQAF